MRPLKVLALFAGLCIGCSSSPTSPSASGNWTPTLGGTATYVTQTGRWERTGDHMWVTGILYVDKLGTGSSVQACGLPMTSAKDQEPSGSVGYYQGLSMNVMALTVTVRPESNCLAFHASLGLDSKSPTIAPFTNGTLIYFSAEYEAGH